MSDDRHSPPRKRARLSSPRDAATSPRHATTTMEVDAETASAPVPAVVTGVRQEDSTAAVMSTATFANAGHDTNHRGTTQQDAEAFPFPAVVRRLPSFLSIVSMATQPQSTLVTSVLGANVREIGAMEQRGELSRARMARRTGPSPPSMMMGHEGDLENEEVVNATMMEMSALDAQPGSEESSSTDDEELQQMTMVNQDASVAVDILSGEGSCEVKFEDLMNTTFTAAREAKLSSLQQCFRIIKKSKNPEELMKRAVDAEDETGLTLLMLSVRNNLLPLTTFLVQEGANVNHSNVRNTHHLCCHSLELTPTHLCLYYYALQEKRTYALLLAAQKGLPEMTKFLVEHGANDESKNMSLIPAAHFGHLPVVQLLLEYNANQNYSNKKGTTPLMRAAQEGRDQVVKFLIEKGADACAANVSLRIPWRCRVCPRQFHSHLMFFV